MNPVIYLTGAPATGKSTLCRNLKVAVPSIAVFSYSEELRNHVRARMRLGILTSDEIRGQSAQLVTRADVAEVDARLLQFVAQQRGERPILIDSHPVTKEAFGFRIAPFTSSELSALAPDVILCLYLDSAEVAVRIKVAPMGRPLPTPFELDLHNHLQANIAVQYGLLLNRPVYLLNSAVGEAALAEAALECTGLLQN
jgi:adenylate kinase